MTSLAIFLAGLFLLSEVFASDIYAKDKSYEELCSVNMNPSFIFMHNPAGYWYLSNNEGASIIYDSSIYPAAGYASCIGSILLSYTLPKEVTDALEKDPFLRVRLEPSQSLSCLDFSVFSYSFKSKETMVLELHLTPYIGQYTLNDFAGGLSCTIPLIDHHFGRNLYRVYPYYGAPGTALGFFSSREPLRTSPPLVHPTQIRTNGSFKEGTIINVDGQNKNSSLYTIGKKGELAFEEAILLEFYCPFKLIFYYGTYDGSSYIPYPGGPGTSWPFDPFLPDPIDPPFTLRIHRKR